MSADAPRLRRIEAFPVLQDGQRYLALRDPAGYAPGVAMIPMALLEIVSLFDGEHSIEAIQAAVQRQSGERVDGAEIRALADALDEHGFLDSAAFAARRAAIDRAFLDAPARAASHAGGAYAADAVSLRSTMDRFFLPPAGPGGIAATTTGPGVRGVIAPHIDFHRGGPAYAWAYRDLGERGDADVWVIFGTCHAGMPDPFALTRKDYETPFGAAAVDRDFVDALAARLGGGGFDSELAHRNEHSIEFQALFLRYLFAGRRDVAIVPVLTSFVHEALAFGRAPEDDPRVARFFDALAATAAASGKRVGYIAGADLAHVGPRFGDPEPLTAADRAALEAEDRTMLDAVVAGDPAAFFQCAVRDGDRRRVCGLSPIWSLLRALDGAPGVLRHYAQTEDPACVVSFASVVF